MNEVLEITISITPRILTFTKTASFTADLDEATSYRVNTDAGAVAVTLPTADSENKGARFSFRKTTASANTSTISTVNSGNITLTAQWDYCTVESNGTYWERIG